MGATIEATLGDTGWQPTVNTQDTTKGCFIELHVDPANPFAQPTASCQEWQCDGQCNLTQETLESDGQGNPTKIRFSCTCGG